MNPGIEVLEQRTHYVYVIWRDDQALYVGQTVDPDRRLREHGYGKRHGATHVDVWEIGDRRDALRLEAAAMGALRTPLNVDGTARVMKRRVPTVAEADAWLAARKRTA